MKAGGAGEAGKSRVLAGASMLTGFDALLHAEPLTVATTRSQSRALRAPRSSAFAFVDPNP